jgi:hypothetical protein
MEEERDFMLTIVTGKKRVGKTFRTAQEVRSYSMDDPSTGRRGMKVLIFDIQQEPQWSCYKTLYYSADEKDELKRAEEIIAFTKSEVISVRRIIPVKSNGQPMNARDMVLAVQTINKYYRRGLLILEDINRIVTSKNQDDLMDALISTRHIQQDIILHLQSLAGATPRMFQNCEWIRFHKQSDPIDRYKNRLPNFTLLKIAEMTVDRIYREGNERFFLYVSPTEEKIAGLSYEQFEKSCMEYLAKYRGELKPYLDEVDLKKGRKRYPTMVEAMKAWIADHKYYWIDGDK